MRAEAIDDPADARLEDYRGLRGRRGARPAEVFVAEGRPLVTQLLAAERFRVRSVVTTPAALPALGGALAAAPQVPVYVMPRAAIGSLVGYPFHRGCLAASELAAPVGLDALLAGNGPRLLLALERIADPENVGALFRNAAAFGAAGVLLAPGAADPLARKALRVSAGAALTMPFARLADWPAALGRLGAAGFTLVALTPPTRMPVAAPAPPCPWPGRVALLLGTEWAGLGPAARAAAAFTVSIPMAPGVDSLNVATAAAIALDRLVHADGWRRRGGEDRTGAT